MSQVLAAFNTTAMVLGYISLALIIGFVGWIAMVWHEKWRYNRRRKRRQDAEWDRVRSAWLRQVQLERIDTVEQRVVDSTDRTRTAQLNFTPEDIYNYEEDFRRDAS